MKLVLTIIMLMFASASSAGELVTHLGSHHAPNVSSWGDKLNNYNPGVGYLSDDGWAVGIYLNSYRRASVYGGYSWERDVGPLKVGFVAAGAHGYQERTSHAVSFVGGLSVSVPLSDGARLRALYAPRVAKDTAQVLHVSINWRL